MPRRSKVGGKRPGSGRKPAAGVARSVTRTVKLTPDEASAHDAARGERPWSDWARGELGLSITRGSIR